MTDKPFALFDMDGTLVDSMPLWNSLHVTYAKEVRPDLGEEEIAYLQSLRGFGQVSRGFEKLGIPGTKEKVMAYMEDKMGGYYTTCVRLKPGAKLHLEHLKQQGIPMGIITLTSHEKAAICLKHTGLDRYISFVLTPEDTPDRTGKEDTVIFEMAMERMGCRHPRDCAFYEDSLYSMKTAKAMGFYTVGIQDRWNAYTEQRAKWYTDAILDWGYVFPGK